VQLTVNCRNTRRINELVTRGDVLALVHDQRVEAAGHDVGVLGEGFPWRLKCARSTRKEGRGSTLD